MKKTVNRATSGLLAAALAFSVCGCGLSANQKTGVATFSAATMDLAALATAELAKTRSDVIEMNELRRKLGDKKVAGFDGRLTLARVKTRVDAVNVLAAYAELLHTLATTSQDDRLKGAADSFVSSLRKARVVELSDEQAGALGQGIQLIGGVVIERMRANAMRRVVASAHPHVARVIDLLERSFGPDDVYWSLEYDTTVEALRGAAAIAEKKPGAADAATRGLIVEARSLAERKAARFASVSRAIRESCRKLRSAEADLCSLMEESDFAIGRIDDYAKHVREFITIYKILAND